MPRNRAPTRYSALARRLFANSNEARQAQSDRRWRSALLGAHRRKSTRKAHSTRFPDPCVGILRRRRSPVYPQRQRSERMSSRPQPPKAVTKVRARFGRFNDVFTTTPPDWTCEWTRGRCSAQSGSVGREEPGGPARAAAVPVLAACRSEPVPPMLAAQFACHAGSARVGGSCLEPWCHATYHRVLAGRTAMLAVCAAANVDPFEHHCAANSSLLPRPCRRVTIRLNSFPPSGSMFAGLN